MDFKKFDLLLKKINTLKQNMDLTDDDVSYLEIDLLKNYIRQLYEVVALPETDVPNTLPSKPKSAETSMEKILYSELKEVKTIEINEEKPVEAVVEKPHQPEVKETVPPVVKDEKPVEVIAVVETVKEIVKVEKPVTEQEIVPVVEPKGEAKKESGNLAELDEIFLQDTSTDLSDKLSSAPLEDIKKAIAINERILAINELFGGNKDLFEETLAFVNKAENFESAKTWIINHVAISNKWAVGDKKGKAKRFIKLIRRRLPK